MEWIGFDQCTLSPETWCRENDDGQMKFFVQAWEQSIEISVTMDSRHCGSLQLFVNSASGE